MSGIEKSVKTESRLVIARGCGRCDWEVIAIACEVSFERDEPVLNLVVTVAQSCDYTKNHWII